VPPLVRDWLTRVGNVTIARFAYPLLVETMADATSLRSGLAVVPVLLALATAGLLVVRRPARLADLAAELHPAEQRRG